MYYQRNYEPLQYHVQSALPYYFFRHIPDFTMSKITANLHVHVSDKLVLTYPLLTTLPHHMLPACYAALPRPYWEMWVSKGLFAIMVLMLVLVVLLAWRNAQMMTNKANGDVFPATKYNDRCLCQFSDESSSGHRQVRPPTANAMVSRDDISEPAFDLKTSSNQDTSMR